MILNSQNFITRIIILTLGTLFSSCMGVSVEKEWTSSRGNHTRSGYYSGDGPTALTNLKWKYKTPAEITSSPIVAGGTVFLLGGTVITQDVYFGRYPGDASLYAIDATTGQEQWVFKTEGSSNNRNSIVSNGTVYFAPRSSKYLYAVDAKTGQEKWRYKTEGEITSDPMVKEDLLFFGTAGEDVKNSKFHLLAVNTATGQEKWKFKAEGRIMSSPAVSDRLVFFSIYNSSPTEIYDYTYVYAVNIDTGQEKWKFRADGSNNILGPVVLKGLILCGDRSIYAVDINTGQEEWKIDLEENFRLGSSPSVAYGHLFFATHLSGFAVSYSKLHAIDVATQQENWTKEYDFNFFADPTVANGMVYFGSHDHHMYALDAYTGQEKWKFKTEGGLNESPAVSDGVLYFGGKDGYLYAVE